MDGVIGADGELIKLSREVRAAIKVADLPAATQAAREAGGQFHTCVGRSPAVPARHSGFARTIACDPSRMLEEQPESIVYRPRLPHGQRR